MPKNENKHPNCEVTSAAAVFSGANVIASERGRTCRKLREAIEICDNRPQINVSAGWTFL